LGDALEEIAAASIIVGAAHVISALGADQLALQFGQPRIAAGTEQHRLIIAWTNALFGVVGVFGIHMTELLCAKQRVRKRAVIIRLAI
jgi:hypothetical protein